MGGGAENCWMKLGGKEDDTCSRAILFACSKGVFCIPRENIECWSRGGMGRYSVLKHDSLLSDKFRLFLCAFYGFFLCFCVSFNIPYSFGPHTLFYWSDIDPRISELCFCIYFFTLACLAFWTISLSQCWTIFFGHVSSWCFDTRLSFLGYVYYTRTLKTNGILCTFVQYKHRSWRFWKENP